MCCSGSTQTGHRFRLFLNVFGVVEKNVESSTFHVAMHRLCQVLTFCCVMTGWWGCDHGDCNVHRFQAVAALFP